MKNDINLWYDYQNTLNPERLDNIYTQEMQNIKEKAIADGTFMNAPNGNTSKLNERQWLTVRTKEFKDWFGDWINDHENASKVVDENGEPLVVYHGSDVQFDKFEFRSQVWFHFWTKEAALHRNASNVKSFFLNIKNLEEKEDILSWFGEPFTKELVRDGSLTENQANDLINSAIEYANTESVKNTTIPRIAFYVKYISESTKELKWGEYWIIYKNKVEDPGSISYIAFSNDQIKLASPTMQHINEVQNAIKNDIANNFQG